MPDKHDGYFRYFAGVSSRRKSLGLLPTVISIGGDGATYDIGFGALSRLLATKTPIKVVVLNTGAYSNTGGQASTASFIGQDSDLSRFGAAHQRQAGSPQGTRPDRLVPSQRVRVFRPAPRCRATSSRTRMEFLTYTDSPAVLDVYTPCQAEHGIADDVRPTVRRAWPWKAA